MTWTHPCLPFGGEDWPSDPEIYLFHVGSGSVRS